MFDRAIETVETTGGVLNARKVATSDWKYIKEWTNIREVSVLWENILIIFQTKGEWECRVGNSNKAFGSVNPMITFISRTVVGTVCFENRMIKTSLDHFVFIHKWISLLEESYVANDMFLLIVFLLTDCFHTEILKANGAVIVFLKPKKGALIS